MAIWHSMPSDYVRSDKSMCNLLGKKDSFQCHLVGNISHEVIMMCFMQMIIIAFITLSDVSLTTDFFVIRHSTLHKEWLLSSEFLRGRTHPLYLEAVFVFCDLFFIHSPYPQYKSLTQQWKVLTFRFAASHVSLSRWSYTCTTVFAKRNCTFVRNFTVK